MILVIGGACQGKSEVARRLLGMDEKAFSEAKAEGERRMERMLAEMMPQMPEGKQTAAPGLTEPKLAEESHPMGPKLMKESHFTEPELAEEPHFAMPKLTVEPQFPFYILSFHLWIRQAMERQLDLNDWTEQVLAQQPLLITMDEVGYGIVPLERRERDYREAVGWAGQRLAAEAEAVYRVICGIPTRIK